MLTGFTKVITCDIYTYWTVTLYIGNECNVTCQLYRIKLRGGWSGEWKLICNYAIVCSKGGRIKKYRLIQNRNIWYFLFWLKPKRVITNSLRFHMATGDRMDSPLFKFCLCSQRSPHPHPDCWGMWQTERAWAVGGGEGRGLRREEVGLNGQAPKQAVKRPRCEWWGMRKAKAEATGEAENETESKVLNTYQIPTL